MEHRKNRVRIVSVVTLEFLIDDILNDTVEKEKFVGKSENIRNEKQEKINPLKISLRI